MANPNKTWGRSKLRINGVTIDCEGKSSLELGGVKRNAVQADYRTGLFNEEDMDSKIECSALVTAGVSLKAFDTDDATITFEADTGQTYVIRHAYLSEPPSVSEGKAKLVYMGPAAEELVL